MYVHVHKVRMCTRANTPQNTGCQATLIGYAQQWDRPDQSEMALVWVLLLHSKVASVSMNICGAMDVKYPTCSCGCARATYTCTYVPWAYFTWDFLNVRTCSLCVGCDHHGGRLRSNGLRHLHYGDIMIACACLGRGRTIWRHGLFGEKAHLINHVTALVTQTLVPSQCLFYICQYIPIRWLNSL